MEDELDEVASGERAWPPVVQEFYDPLEKALEAAADAPRVEQQTDEKCEKCGKPMIVRWGRFGQFLACTGFPECKNTRPVGEEAAQSRSRPTRSATVCESPMVSQARPLRPVPRVHASTRSARARARSLKKVGVLCPKDGGEIVEQDAAEARAHLLRLRELPELRLHELVRAR